MVKKFLKDEQGQDVVEYSLLLVVIGTAVLLVLTVMGQSITNIFLKVNGKVASAEEQVAP